MTLVVARCDKGRIAIAADTLLTEHGSPLPINAGVVKSCCLPGYICVSFSGSPELAEKAFRDFSTSFPRGANFSSTVSFFQSSSSSTGNDYLIAFGDAPRLVTIRAGHRVDRISKTHWIGDKAAFESFREYETQRKARYEQGRAVNVAMFADEMTGSPASELYSTMRNVVREEKLHFVRGFVSVLSNRDIVFRYSVCSDILMDRPKGLSADGTFALTDKFDLHASRENYRFSMDQISPGYYNMNVVAFYVLKGKLLFIFRGTNNGVANRCSVIQNVEPSHIATAIDKELNFAFKTLCMVMSVRQSDIITAPRDNVDYGIRMNLFCEANTMPILPTRP